MIKTNIWSDPWFTELSEKGQRLFLYFLTNESTRISGIYTLPLRRIAGDMRWDDEVTKQTIKELEPKVLYIEGWVCITNYQRHQNVTNNTKVQLAIEKELAEVPQHVLARKSEIINTIHKHNSEGMGRVGIPYQNEKNASTEPQKRGGKKSGKTVDNSIYSSEFERAWSQYPRKVGKGAAWKAWQALHISPQLAELIIAKVTLYKGTKQWQKEGGQFIPHMATFLNQRRFDDDPEGGSGSHLADKYAGL